MSLVAANPRSFRFRSASRPSAGRRCSCRRSAIPTRLQVVGLVHAGGLAEIYEWDNLNPPDDSAGQTAVVALRVLGDSMLGAGIRDGDYVVVRRLADGTETPAGEIVVAVTGDGRATLKRWVPEPHNGRVRLEPANPDFRPVYARDAQVWGVLIGVARAVRAKAGGAGAGGAHSRGAHSRGVTYRVLMCRIPKRWRPGGPVDLPPRRKVLARRGVKSREAAERMRLEFNRSELREPAGLWLVVEEVA